MKIKYAGALMSLAVFSTLGSVCSAQEAPANLPPAVPISTDMKPVESNVPKAPPAACHTQIYTASSITGLAKKSGFAKFALGVVLPSVLGSVAGSGGGGGGFEAGRALGGQSAVFANNKLVDRTSDVPIVIANQFSQVQQGKAVQTTLERFAAQLGTTSFSIDEGNAPLPKTAPARAQTMGLQCLRVLTIDSIVFEHSNNYKTRNAIVVASSLAEYTQSSGKPVTSVRDVYSAPISKFMAENQPSSPDLDLELAGALDGAMNSIAETFQKKRK